MADTQSVPSTTVSTTPRDDGDFHVHPTRPPVETEKCTVGRDLDRPGRAREGTISRAWANFDRDIGSEAVTVYQPESQSSWVLNVAWSNGSRSAVLIEPQEPSGRVEALSIWSTGDAPPDEIFLRVGEDDSTSEIGMVQMDGCTPRRVSLDGEPAVFTVGRVEDELSGLTCYGDRISLGRWKPFSALEATTADDEVYEWKSVSYDLVDGALIVANRDSGIYRRPRDDEAIKSLSRFDCTVMPL